MKDKLIVAILLYPNSKYVQNNNNEFKFFFIRKSEENSKVHICIENSTANSVLNTYVSVCASLSL